MPTVTITRGDSSWMDLPMNVESESDCVFTGAEQYAYTGFLGALCDNFKRNGLRGRLQIAAVNHPQGMRFGAKHVAGYGSEAVTSRMSISPLLYFTICACQGEGVANLLPPELDIQIVNAGARTYIPQFLENQK